MLIGLTLQQSLVLPIMPLNECTRPLSPSDPLSTPQTETVVNMLYITNLDGQIRMNDLHLILNRKFSPFGFIVQIRVKETHTNGLKGYYAFIEYSEGVNVLPAIQKLNGKLIGEHRINVQLHQQCRSKRLQIEEVLPKYRANSESSVLIAQLLGCKESRKTRLRKKKERQQHRRQWAEQGQGLHIIVEEDEQTHQDFFSESSLEIPSQNSKSAQGGLPKSKKVRKALWKRRRNWKTSDQEDSESDSFCFCQSQATIL